MARRRTKRDATRPLRGLAPHFTRDGSPKTPYRTQAEAASAAQLAWSINQVELDTYRCDYCHQWHVGRRFSRD